MDLSIPALAELAEQKRWVCWCWQKRNGKPTKVPLQPDGRAAKSNDPATWSSFDACDRALESNESIDGLGIMLGDGYCGIDLDNAIDPTTGAPRAWAKEILDEVQSYGEISPSGKGVKIFLRCEPVPKLSSHLLTIEKHNDDKDEQVELYTDGRYFCVTGQHLEDTPETIEDSTGAFERLAWRVARGARSTPIGPNDTAELLRRAAEVDTAGLPAAFAHRLRSDAKVAACWLEGRKIGNGKDNSASGLDASLACYLSRHLARDELEAVLRAFPYGQIGSGKLAGKDADRQIRRLLENTSDLSDFENTQDGIARCFTERHKHDLRYCHTTGAWFCWTGTHWQRDQHKRAFSWARHVGQELGFDGKAATCAGAERFAQSDALFAVTHETWDTDPYLLGTPGGVVDLRSGTLRVARREDSITRLTAVAPSPGDHPLWARFLNDATRPQAMKTSSPPCRG